MFEEYNYNILEEGNLEQELVDVKDKTIDDEIDELLETLVITKNSIKHLTKTRKNKDHDDYLD